MKTGRRKQWDWGCKDTEDDSERESKGKEQWDKESKGKWWWKQERN